MCASLCFNLVRLGNTSIEKFGLIDIDSQKIYKYVVCLHALWGGVQASMYVCELWLLIPKIDKLMWIGIAKGALSTSNNSLCLNTHSLCYWNEELRFVASMLPCPSFLCPLLYCLLYCLLVCLIAQCLCAFTFLYACFAIGF